MILRICNFFEVTMKQIFIVQNYSHKQILNLLKVKVVTLFTYVVRMWKNYIIPDDSYLVVVFLIVMSYNYTFIFRSKEKAWARNREKTLLLFSMSQVGFILYLINKGSTATWPPLYKSLVLKKQATLFSFSSI